MCRLVGSIWKCGDHFLGWRQCNDSRVSNISPLHCKHTPNAEKVFAPLTKVQPQLFTARLLTVEDLELVPSDCSPHCCQRDLDSIAAQCDNVWIAKERTRARDGYTTAVLRHMDECMPAFAQGLWKTNSMRAKMGEPTLKHNVIPSVRTECLRGKPRIVDVADILSDANKKALKDYEERLLRKEGINRADESGSVKICLELNRYAKEKKIGNVVVHNDVGGGGEHALSFTHPMGAPPVTLATTGIIPGGIAAVAPKAKPGSGTSALMTPWPGGVPPGTPSFPSKLPGAVYSAPAASSSIGMPTGPQKPIPGSFQSAFTSPGIAVPPGTLPTASTIPRTALPPSAASSPAFSLSGLSTKASAPFPAPTAAPSTSSLAKGSRARPTRKVTSPYNEYMPMDPLSLDTSTPAVSRDPSPMRTDQPAPAVGKYLEVPLRLSTSPEKEAKWHEVFERTGRDNDLAMALVKATEPTWIATKEQLGRIEKVTHDYLLELDREFREAVYLDDFSSSQRKQIALSNIPQASWLASKYPLIKQNLERQIPSLSPSFPPNRLSALVLELRTLRDKLRELEGRHNQWMKGLSAAEQRDLKQQIAGKVAAKS